MIKPRHSYRPDPEIRQFTIRRLLVLAVFCAVIGGIGRTLDMRPDQRMIFIFVWMGVAFYLVIRLPYVALWLLGRTNRQKRLKTDRAELEAMAERKRREYREGQHDRDQAAG